jgi:hypothetical protein
MITKQVGPYTVKTLTVSEGLDLLYLASGEDQAKFQKELLLSSVARDGKRIDGDDFGELMAHISEIVPIAMELNGFRKSENE